MTYGTPQESRWGQLGSPRAYIRFISPAEEQTPDTIPARPEKADGGATCLRHLATLPPADREAAIRDEVGRGNIPEFLRGFRRVTVQARDAAGHEHVVSYGPIVAGIKKDIVITNLLASHPRRAAIYGWHRPDGAPIQPLTVVHTATYVDYSHGVRLVKRRVLVDGRPMDLRDVLKDPLLAPLLSDEGPILTPSY